MTERKSRDASRQETLAAYRAGGGRPADHPDRDNLLQAAGIDRWIYRDTTKAVYEAIAEAERTPVQAMSLELLWDDELADWFLDGLPADVAEGQASDATGEWDVLHRPWRAGFTVRSDGFRCDISGRTDGAIALQLTPRYDEDRDPILLHPDEVMGLLQRMLAAIDEGTTLGERMGPGRQLRLEARLAALGTAPQDRERNTQAPRLDGNEDQPPR
jgi:hypothetical protein